MLKVIKNKGKMVRAYQLGSKSPVIGSLTAEGKIEELGDGIYAVHSLEAAQGNLGGEIARTGDWIKIGGNGRPYPNSQAFFEKNHRHIVGDLYEQFPEPLLAWEAECGMCPEVEFLIRRKGLEIDETSMERRYSAELWGTREAAAADAVIVFYSISRGCDGCITDADFNFVERGEFEKTYSVTGREETGV